MQHLPTFRHPMICLIVIGPSQYTIHFGRSLICINGLKRLNDFLVFIVLMPLLTFFQDVHMSLLDFGPSDLLTHAVTAKAKRQ